MDESHDVPLADRLASGTYGPLSDRKAVLLPGVSLVLAFFAFGLALTIWFLVIAVPIAALSLGMAAYALRGDRLGPDDPNRSTAQIATAISAFVLFAMTGFWYALLS